MERCFVAGATGYVGRAVIDALIARGPRTRAIAHVRPDSRRLDGWRDRFAADGAEVEVVPWEIEPLAATLRRHGATHVFVLIGTTRARARLEAIPGDPYEAIDLGLTKILCEAARASGARPRLIYLSSIGADPDAGSRYLRARGDAEAAVTGSGLPALIARPSFITGPDREESRPGERAAAAITDAALAAAALFGGRRLRDRWGSLDAAKLAAALIRLGIDEAATGVVEGDRLRGAT